MTYQEALQYLNRFIDLEKRESYGDYLSFKLDRMRRLSSLLGDPQDAIKSIHVAGTKGKGSTAAIIQSILKCSGLKVGLYTSPHLVSFRERIRIDDDMISESDVCRLLTVAKSAVDMMADDKPTFFEIYTALAFLYFKDRLIDIAVYEAGLGGRLDATNVIDPLVTVLTPVSFDHTNILGDSLAKIAFEKAGIIKEDCVLVSAPQDDEALKVIDDVCRMKSSQMVLVGRDIILKEVSASDEETVFNFTGLFGKHKNLHLKLLGFHQAVNAATAIGTVEALRLSGISVSDDAIRRGLEAAKWPGRMEVVRNRSPRIILDGAQNKASADALSRSVRRLFKYKKLILILGVSKDKDIKGILKELVPIADSIILTKSKMVERAMDPEAIRDLITPKTKVISVTHNTGEALDMAFSQAKPSDLILVTGSLFVVGEAREILVREG